MCSQSHGRTISSDSCLYINGLHADFGYIIHFTDSDITGNNIWPVKYAAHIASASARTYFSSQVFSVYNAQYVSNESR